MSVRPAPVTSRLVAFVASSALLCAAVLTATVTPANAVVPLRAGAVSRAAAASSAPLAPRPGRATAPPAASSALASTTGRQAGTAAASGERELPVLRTLTSRTFQTPGGPNRTVIAEAPLNFRDTRGAWQPIDDSLVPDGAAGFAYRNASDGYQVEFPGDLATGPIRLSTGGKWLAFSLRGAGHSTGVVSGNAITYSNVLPGVSVTYFAQPDGLKESLTLAGSTSASSFVFDAIASPGLTGKGSRDGFRFADSAGRLALLLTAPWVGDAADDTSGFAGVVRFTGASTSTGMALTLTVAPSWLSDPARRFPVVIDPSISPTGTAVTDCHVVQGYPTTSYCNSTAREVGLGADAAKIRRTLLKFDTSALPADAQVLSADLGLYVTNMYGTTGSVPIQVHRATGVWNTAATWNTSNGTSGWTGGNPGPGSTFTGSAGPAVNTWSYLSFIPLMQSWVNGGNANDGIVLMSGNEASAGVFRFNSSRGASNTPTVSVSWTLMAGQQPGATYLNTPISGHATLGVNPVTGNALLSTKALAVKGTNLDFDLTRYYNSRSAADGYDNGIDPWSSSIGDGLSLHRNVNNGVTNSVAVSLPGGASLPFERRTSGGPFVSPAGVDASLQLSTTPGSGYDTLLFHGSGIKYTYSEAVADFSNLDSMTSKTGNTITVTHLGGSPSSVTDTQGRTFTYSGLQQPRTVSDDGAGRMVTYATPSGGAGFTDANGGVYTYGFDAAGKLLTSVSDPLGHVTTVAYDSTSRVSSVTRTTTDCNNYTIPVTTRYAYGAQDGAGPAGTTGMTTVTDPLGHTTRYYSDAARRVVQVTDSLNRKRTTGYDPTTGNIASLADNLGMATTATYYTGQRNLQTVSGPTETDGTKMQTQYGTYNGSNQPAPSSVTDTRNNRTTFGFTADSNNVNQSTSPSGRVDRLTYNSNGTVATKTPGLGGVTTLGYDSAGNLTKVTPPGGNTLGATTIGNDSDSRPTAVTDGKGQVTRTGYDRLDRTTSVTYADATHVNYTYDANDNLTSRTDRNGTVSNIGFDNLNRPRTQSDPGSGETATICYNAGNDVTSVQQQHGGTDLGTTSYGYDSTGAVTSVQEPGGNCGNQPNGYPAAGSGCVNLGYDGAGRRSTETYPGGIKTTTGYTNSGMVTDITTRKLDNTVVISRAYTYEEPIAGSTSMRMTSSVASTTDQLGQSPSTATTRTTNSATPATSRPPPGPPATATPTTPTGTGSPAASTAPTTSTALTTPPTNSPPARTAAPRRRSPPTTRTGTSPARPRVSEPPTTAPTSPQA